MEVALRVGTMNPRLRSITILSMLLPVVLPLCSAGADELSASSSARTFSIHDAASTLRDYCSTSTDGRLWFTLPDGPSFELVTSTQDPAILNPGDGAFHPFDVAEVQAALSSVRFPLGTIGAEVFILPYPRRVQIESAAGRGVILLSPGVRPLSTEHQHAEFVHELGHVVQYALMPDGDPRWSEYRSLRAIGDASRYSALSAHADRPHEIFAEDFRALFGGATANYSG